MPPPTGDARRAHPPDDATLPPSAAGNAANGVTVPLTPDVPPELVNHPRYRVLRLLGQGGMGAVYLAEHLVMGRRVALKTINTRFLTSPNAVGRFHREVQAAAKLAHANVVAAYDAEQAGDLHFLIMEYVEGVSVADYVRHKGPLPVPQACAICGQAALGLQHAHERGLVHRDIKPHNLMLTAKGQVKVLDFGLAHVARQEGSDGDSSLTATGTIVGTADYIAPEQTGSAHAVDIRADVYSLGCTLYYLLTARVPFPGGTVVEKCVHHALDAPPPLSSLRPGLPAALVAVVETMMAKRPEKRFPTPAEVFRALRPFAEGHASATAAAPAADGPGLASGPPAGETTSQSLTEALRAVPVARASPRGDPWRKKALLFAVAVALAFTVLGAVLLAFVLGPPGNEPGKDSHVAAASPPTQRAATQEAKGVTPAVKAVSWEGEVPKRVIADPAHALNEVLDFREVVGAPRKEFHAWREALGADFRLSFLNTRKGSGPALFNAVAVRERKPLLARVFPDLPPAEEVQTYRRLLAEKGRYLGEGMYAEAGQLFHSFLWVQDDQRWYAWLGDMRFMTAKVAEEKKAGMRPIFFEAAWSGDRGYYRAVGATDQGLAWEPYYTLGPEELLAAVEFGKRKGQRPDALSAYWDGERFRFLLVTRDNSEPVDWLYRMDLTLAEYKKTSAEQKRLGLLPLVITSYGDEADVHYAAVWVRYRIPN
jgi:hypothetical protein